MLYVLIVVSFIVWSVPLQAKKDPMPVGTIFSVSEKVFAGLDLDYDQALELASQMKALSNAGLDPTVPFKAAGVDMEQTMEAFGRCAAIFALINAGLDKDRALSCYEHGKKDSVNLKDEVALLMAGLHAAGQMPDSSKVADALKQAQVLIEAGQKGHIAFEAAGIDPNAIPLVYDDPNGKKPKGGWKFYKPIYNIKP